MAIHLSLSLFSSLCVYAYLFHLFVCLCLFHHNAARELESTQNLSFALLCSYIILILFSIFTSINQKINNEILLISEQVCPCDKIKQLN